MKFGQMIDVHHSGLYVTERHEEWLQKNPNPVYSPAAIEFARETFATPQRDRTESFSASSMGGCPRAAQFQFLGVPQRRITDAHLINVFHTGNYIHLKWQMAGITAGWLTTPEPFFYNQDLQLKGSLDGILDNGWGLEIKSINSNGYRNVLQHGGKKAHLQQVDSYFLLNPELECFSLIYENKDTQDYKEIVIQKDEERVAKMLQHLSDLGKKTASGELFDIRDDCWKGEGAFFRNCPYNKMCRNVHGCHDL